MIRGIKKILLNIYVILCRLVFGTNRKKFLFTSFNGSGYSDNPKILSETIHKMDSSIKISWILPKDYNECIPDYIEIIPNNNNLKIFKEISSSKVFVSNFALPDIPKGQKQFFVQTWHGDRGFKKMLYDAPDQIPGFHLAESKKGFCNLAVAGSSFGENLYRTAFRFDGKIVNVGCPRNDLLVSHNQERIGVIKEKLGIGINTRILLYAPTLRQKTQKSSQIQNVEGINVERTIDVLEEKYNGNWICLIRSHPGIVGLGGYESQTEKLLDVSRYPDMADLLLVSDILITDYSSSAGDFALLHRPVYLFQPDAEEFIKRERTMYFDLDKSPYIICKSQVELEREIRNTSMETTIKNCDEILNFYGTNETGESSQIISEIIINSTK